MTAQHALYIHQGARYVQRFPVLNTLTGAAVDATGWAVACQVRAAKGAGSALLVELAPTAANGYIELAIPAATSAGWTWREGYYDLVLTEPGQDPSRLSQGPVYVDPRTTVPA
jgi:hypothetical protein